MGNMITKLQTITSEDDIENTPIGVYSDNVIISDQNTKISLTQIYNYLKEFFQTKIFLWAGDSCPANNNIISFYKIEDN
jgi:hypothetical protein